MSFVNALDGHLFGISLIILFANLGQRMLLVRIRVGVSVEAEHFWQASGIEAMKPVN